MQLRWLTIEESIRVRIQVLCKFEVWDLWFRVQDLGFKKSSVPASRSSEGPSRQVSLDLKG